MRKKDRKKYLPEILLERERERNVSDSLLRDIERDHAQWDKERDRKKYLPEILLERDRETEKCLRQTC